MIYNFAQPNPRSQCIQPCKAEHKPLLLAWEGGGGSPPGSGEDGHVVIWGRISYWFKHKCVKFREIQNSHLTLICLQL